MPLMLFIPVLSGNLGGPEFILKSGDVLLLIRKKKGINNAIEYLESDKFLVAKYHR